MKQDYILTVARPSQIEDIYKLCLAAFREGSEGSLEVEPEKMRGMVDMLVRDDHQLAVVAMKNGRPKGVVLGHVDSHAYCKGLVASDICIYVAPSLRGTECAADLVGTYSRWCSRIPNLVGSTISTSRIGATTAYMEHLFKEHGYVKAGVSYMKLTG